MSANVKMPAGRAGSSSSEGTHAELMRQMGSKEGFDPMPPSQHGYLLDINQPVENRAIAWVWSKTIRPGRGRKRTPQCHDERGDLRLKHAEADLGWSQQQTSKVFAQLASQNRIRYGDKGRIFLVGDAPPPRRIISERSDDNTCTDVFSRQLSVYLQQLTEKSRVQWVQDYSIIESFCKKVEAEAIAAARAQTRQIRESYYQTTGFQKKVAGRPPAERSNTLIKLSLTDFPKTSVQISFNDSVQNDEVASVQPERPSVQMSASLLNSESQRCRENPIAAWSAEERDEEGSSSSSETNPPPTPTTTKLTPRDREQKPSVEELADDRAVVAKAVARHASPEPHATAELLDRCRRAAPEVTAAEIATAIHEKAHLARGRVIGFLLTAVPALFADGGLKQIRSLAAAPVGFVPEPPAPDDPEEYEAQTLADLLAEFPDHSRAPEMRARLEALRAGKQ